MIARARFSLLVSAGLIFPAAPCSVAFSADRSPGGDISCKWPVDPDETGQVILRRHGKQGRIEIVADLDGETAPGLLLYPDDPTLRLEIAWFGDVIGNKPVSLYLREKASRWSVSGLKIGMTLEEAARVNGGPLDLSGFEQLRDGGPNAVSVELPQGKPKHGCRMIAVFSAPPGVTIDMLGPLYGPDHISSDNPELLKIGAVLSDLVVVWEPTLDK